MPRNQLLSRFPAAILQRLNRHLNAVDILAGQEIHRAGSEVEAVCFPLDCVISVVLPAGGGRMQVGIVGNREMVGLNAIMGTGELNGTAYVVQVGGTAVCVPADLMLREFSESQALRNLLLKYAQSYIAQVSQNVVCAGTHSVRQRVARILLEAQSRTGRSELVITQDKLALMLGVRRASVCDELPKLAADGIITTGRESVVIRNKAGLADIACDCFATLQREYKRLLD